MELSLVEPVKASYKVIALPSSELSPQYIPLVFSKWLRSLRFGNPLFKNIDSNAFYTEYHRYLENLLRKPDSVTRLAVLTDDADVVLGFSVSREDVLDYVHVHKDYRKLGIGRALLPKSFTTFSHVTLTAMEIWRGNPKYRQLKFNPFA